MIIHFVEVLTDVRHMLQDIQQKALLLLLEEREAALFEQVQALRTAPHHHLLDDLVGI